jgi:WD40 repeat protein
VKLWEITNVTNGGGTIGAVGSASMKNLLEFYDHETSVQVVALHPTATLAAAGAEDGTLIIWDLPYAASTLTQPSPVVHVRVASSGR